MNIGGTPLTACNGVSGLENSDKQYHLMSYLWLADVGCSFIEYMRQVLNGSKRVYLDYI